MAFFQRRSQLFQRAVRYSGSLGSVQKGAVDRDLRVELCEFLDTAAHVPRHFAMIRIFVDDFEYLGRRALFTEAPLTEASLFFRGERV